MIIGKTLLIVCPYMFYEVDASNKRDVVGVEAEDGEALDDGLQLLHPLLVDLSLLGSIPPDVKEFPKGGQKLLWQAVKQWSCLIRKMQVIVLCMSPCPMTL